MTGCSADATTNIEFHGEKVFVLRVRQAIICFGPILITISLGLAEGYSAILLPQLVKDENWHINSELSSWIASIATLPMSVGCLLGGWLMEVIGRKMLHLVTCVPNIIGWLLIGCCGQNLTMLLAGRFITGMCVGVLSPVLVIYVAETSDPSFRGFLLPALSLALNIGIALAHILGTYLEWKLVALLALIFPSGCFILMLFVPESPTYLIKKGKPEMAKNAFDWFRGHSVESNAEFAILSSKQIDESSLSRQTFLQHLEVFKRPEFYKPLLILMIFFSTMQWAGNNPIAFYTVTILQGSLGDSSINPYTSMLIMDGVRIFASVLGCFAQQYLKRRKLMMISCSGTTISLLVLSLYLFLNGRYPSDADLSWIVVASFVGYVLFINAGLLPLPYSMSGELFAQSSRGLGSGIVTLYNMILMFILVKITPSLFEGLGPAGTFLLFAICCFVGMGLLIATLPETKDKPLHEIEECFKGSDARYPNLRQML
ncbi:facilitated trehalose transporter Tret1-2 homolog isoform X1 [Dendroctonus ponderosae]|nr:facilitated trehalose transporter Tret1-2 homolog isoform X1 [Dendroctonus ponderosae]